MPVFSCCFLARLLSLLLVCLSLHLFPASITWLASFLVYRVLFLVRYGALRIDTLYLEGREPQISFLRSHTLKMIYRYRASCFATVGGRSWIISVLPAHLCVL